METTYERESFSALSIALLDTRVRVQMIFVLLNRLLVQVPPSALEILDPIPVAEELAFESTVGFPMMLVLIKAKLPSHIFEVVEPVDRAAQKGRRRRRLAVLHALQAWDLHSGPFPVPMATVAQFSHGHVFPVVFQPPGVRFMEARIEMELHRDAKHGSLIALVHQIEEGEKSDDPTEESAGYLNDVNGL